MLKLNTPHECLFFSSRIKAELNMWSYDAYKALHRGIMYYEYICVSKLFSMICCLLSECNKNSATRLRSLYNVLPALEMLNILIAMQWSVALRSWEVFSFNVERPSDKWGQIIESPMATVRKSVMIRFRGDWYPTSWYWTMSLYNLLFSQC